ncbi:MAG: hypothetical protein OEV00_09100, partial [Acidobacteriota bacterium]|nr:hypothetical protein [Acidobacteriota bacterium]
DGFGIDNTELGWEEFHAGPNTGDCGVSGQCGQVSFSVGTLQTSCQNEPVEIRVIDGDAIGSSLMVTVTSTSGGDSEAVVLSRQGASELFLGSVAVSTVSGSSVGDGVVFALPADQLLATYDDLDDGTGSPCSDVTSALTDYPSANISIASRTVTMDNGDADNNPDTNEDFAFELELFNDSATTLTNATVFIETDSLAVSCLIRDSADFGTILGGAMVSNPGSPFRFQVDPAYECDAMGDPDTLTFGVTVLSDEICGADGRLTTSFTLDIDLGGGPIAPPPPSAQLAFSDEDSRDPDARFGSVPIQRSSSRVLEASTTSRPVATVGQDPMSISPPAGDEESDTNRAEGFIVQASSTEGVVSVTRGTPGDAQVNATRAVCGNAQYDNGTADTAEWFNGGMAGNTDCAMGQLWNASDFGIVGDYEVTAICIDNSINFGGPWPNHWYMHPDLAGAPDFGTILADGILSSGDGAGQVEFPLPAPVGFTAGQNYWIVVRGDPVCCSGEDFNLEVDQVTAAVQSFRNDCDGVANMTTPSTGEYVIHSTIFASNLVCDTTDNSGLPTSCATSVSEPGSSPLLVSRIPGPVNNIVDLEFEDAGSVFDYNVFVSNSASSLAAAPFDVEGPNGRKDCAVVTSDLGATREITGYDVGAGITGNDLVFILVGTSTAVHNGPLGDNTPEGARNSTSLCVAVP